MEKIKTRKEIEAEKKEQEIKVKQNAPTISPRQNNKKTTKKKNILAFILFLLFGVLAYYDWRFAVEIVVLIELVKYMESKGVFL